MQECAGTSIEHTDSDGSTRGTMRHRTIFRKPVLIHIADCKHGPAKEFSGRTPRMGSQDLAIVSTDNVNSTNSKQSLNGFFRGACEVIGMTVLINVTQKSGVVAKPRCWLRAQSDLKASPGSSWILGFVNELQENCG